MLADNIYPLLKCWCSKLFAGLYIMLYFIKYPGITDGRTAYHNAINAITVLIFQRLLCTVNIPITKNGYLYAWVVFHFCNQCPVSFSFIHLHSCTAMYT